MAYKVAKRFTLSLGLLAVFVIGCLSHQEVVTSIATDDGLRNIIEDKKTTSERPPLYLRSTPCGHIWPNSRFLF